MAARRKTSLAVGLLFLVSYLNFAVGTALIAPIFDPTSDLSTIGLMDSRLVTGIFIESVNVVAIVGIACLLYPVLKGASAGLALAYVAFRVLEGAMYFVVKVGAFSLLGLASQAGPTGAVRPVEAALRAGTLGANTMATFAFIVSAIILYWLLYRSRLVPRFIAVWGWIAITLLAAGNLLGVDLTAGFTPLMLLFVPIMLNELFLAGWLIVRGFGHDTAPPPAPHEPVAATLARPAA